MPLRLWQRQAGEAPADFTAFIAYLRLKGPRSHRLVAAQTGRSLGAIRRLSAQFNWRARVAAFEARLADSSQNALDLLVRATSSRTTADYQRLREAEVQLALRVLRESSRWLRLASDPRRREVSLGQVCHVIELATKLGRLAAGMPLGDEPSRRAANQGAHAGWTGLSADEALQKIYGSPAPAPSAASESAGPPLPDSSVSSATNLQPETCKPPPSTPADPSLTAPEPRRRDAWSAWTRHQRRAATRQI